MSLSKKITSKTAKVAVIGLGYVGLPLAVEIAKRGFDVLGIEKQGQKEVLAKEISKGKIITTSTYQELASRDIAIIAVPTPLTKTHEPDLSHVVSATNQIAKHLHQNQLVILESTTYPGTTEEVLLPILQSNGLEVGKDFFLSYSPERIDPSEKKYGVSNIPKIVSGVTSRCLDLTKHFYKQFIDEVIDVSSTRVAEMAKILENVFRSVNVALANEMALLCERMNIDVWEVVKAASTKPFGFMTFYPGPGLGGHCVPIDPFYLSWKAREYEFHTEFIELAGKINHSMPYYVVEKITKALNAQGKVLKGSKILILGVAYKKDIDDLRESPALRIIDLLNQREAMVSYFDPYVKNIHIDKKSYSSELLSKSALGESDCVVIVTDHSNVDYEMVVKHSELIVDTRNALDKFKDKSNIVKI